MLVLLVTAHTHTHTISLVYNTLLFIPGEGAEGKDRS